MMVNSLDLDKIYRYRADNIRHCKPLCDSEYWLREWSQKKEWLYKLFGEKFIISRDFEFPESAEKTEKLRDLRDSVVAVLRDAGVEYYDTLSVAEFEFFKTNKITRDVKIYYEDKSFTLKTGTKTFRALRPIFEALGIMDKFEELRIEHSKIFNEKVKTTIYLSIHPLDFMTMSDNENCWSSCMSWLDEGCYRQGTIEMLNSPYVVVAYTKSSKDIMDGFWNNKSWRELYIVDPSCIINVKGYPNIFASYSKAVVEWLKELMEEKYNINYTPTDFVEDYRYAFETNYMYNDIDADPYVPRFMYIQKENFHHINYSGNFVCAECGAIEEPLEHNGDTGSITCISCAEPIAHCHCCGEPLCNDDDIHYFKERDDEPVCYDCRCNYFVDNLTGSFLHWSNETTCYTVIDNELYELRTTFSSIEDYNHFEYHGDYYIFDGLKFYDLQNWNRAYDLGRYEYPVDEDDVYYPIVVKRYYEAKREYEERNQ